MNKRLNVRRCIAFSLCMFVIILISAALVGCNSEVTKKQKADFTRIRTVAELATLDCYYHNVAKVDIEPDGPFPNLFNIGCKRLWVEYSGTVEVGVDASQILLSRFSKIRCAEGDGPRRWPSSGSDTGFSQLSQRPR